MIQIISASCKQSFIHCTPAALEYLQTLINILFFKNGGLFYFRAATANFWALLKVNFSKKGLMHLSFLQTGKPNHFPELKF